MARPKKQVEPDFEENQDQPLTEQVQAPVTYMPPPKRVHVEREGNRSEPLATPWPQIRGGICDFCGVLDPYVESKFQYKLCPHYRGLDARCTYCPESKDPNDVVYHEVLRVMEYPIGSGTLIMWCGSFNCSQAHEKRFKRAGR